jgi:hypothetical protein
MAMLALFASLAISFVFYADSEAVTSELYLNSMAQTQPDIDKEVLAAYFLSQLIYDTDNPYSAMRGWGLARSMYGYNPSSPQASNFTPYNGSGRSILSYSDPTLGVDNFKMINYQKFSTDGFERTPEFYGHKGDPNYRYVGGANPPWTAYDTNNLFLALVGSPVAGQPHAVLMPSFSRPWNRATGAAAKYMSLRPDPTWNPQFTNPWHDLGGDVRNLEYGPGSFLNGTYYNNDSNWMDLGFPVMIAPNGQKYKPLFAPLVVDLNNRLNLWAHGNRLGTDPTTGNAIHVSNLGIGPTEVNLSRVLQNYAELQALFNLKYGGLAGTATSAPPATSPNRFTQGGPNYAQLDYNAWDKISQLSSLPMYFEFQMVSLNPVSRGAQTVNVAGTSGTGYGGFPWSVRNNMFLYVKDATTPANSEIVQVSNVTPTSFKATFANAHAGGVQLVSYFPNPTPATRTAPANLMPPPPPFGIYGFPRFSYLPYAYTADGAVGWDNQTQHLQPTYKPLGLNIFNPVVSTTDPNVQNTRPQLASDLEALLRWGGTNSPALTSEIFRRMPQTFNDFPTRNMVTTASWHMDRASASPYLPFNRTLASSQYYSMNATKKYPTIGTFPAVNVAQPSTVATTNSEFTPDWRSALGNYLKVNLNRKLTDYSAAASTAGANPQAVQDRTAFAKDIYQALIRVTGAQDPNVVPGMAVTSPQYYAAQWLAQLAVNIVDYIDDDNNITPFNWDTVNSAWVYGTELPRLVLNEVYTEYDNDPAHDPGLANYKDIKKNPTPSASYTKQNFWLELYNPCNPYTTLAGDWFGYFDQNIAHLPGYQILVFKSSAALTQNMNDPANPTVNIGLPDKTTYTPITTFTMTGSVQPESMYLAGSNQTDYVTVPAQKDAAKNWTNANRDPFLASKYFTNPKLDLSAAEFSVKIQPYTTTPPKVTLLLQRLAAPNLPFDAKFNPYITVDYVDDIEVWNNQAYTQGGLRGAQLPAVNTYSSTGRQQPYDATRFGPQSTPGGTAPNLQPLNTFGKFNDNRTSTFDWLVHLDRQLINPLELLYVSQYRPHQLTQKFMTPIASSSAIAPGGQIAPWTSDSKSLIYRALEVLGTPSHMSGTFPGGRIPGNINLNTITELAIFQALCDSQDQQAAPLFRQTDVQNVFNNVVQSRNSPPTNRAAGPNLLPTGEGYPFEPFAADKINKTWLRPNPNVTGTTAFGIGGAAAHPYLQHALLQKIYNNITTTSNVFAVWWTVGFFEVVDDTVMPARLGQEIGQAENRQIRHRFFAIVDRSGLQLFNTTLGQAVSAGTQTLSLTIPSTLSNGQSLTLQPGMMLEIGDSEVVVIQSATGNQFTATFTKAHGAGAAVICRGNPGPQVNYNPHRDGYPQLTGPSPRNDKVLLHMSFIQ